MVLSRIQADAVIAVVKEAALGLVRYVAEHHLNMVPASERALNMVPASERALFFAAGFISGFIATYPVRHSGT